MTILAAEEVRRFGMTPRVALLSHSSFGSDQNDPSAQKMREVYRLLSEQAPELEVEGEMHGDAALMKYSSFCIPKLTFQRFCKSVDHAESGCSEYFI
jgi:phosphotransacetylase